MLSFLSFRLLAAVVVYTLPYCLSHFLSFVFDLTALGMANGLSIIGLIDSIYVCVNFHQVHLSLSLSLSLTNHFLLNFVYNVHEQHAELCNDAFVRLSNKKSFIATMIISDVAQISAFYVSLKNIDLHSRSWTDLCEICKILNQSRWKLVVVGSCY